MIYFFPLLIVFFILIIQTKYLAKRNEKLKNKQKRHFLICFFIALVVNFLLLSDYYQFIINQNLNYIFFPLVNFIFPLLFNFLFIKIIYPKVIKS